MEYSQNNNKKRLCSLDKSKIIDCESVENSIGISLCRLVRLSMVLICICLIFSHTNTTKSLSKEAYIARQADSLALVELYHATGGENWKVKWDLSQPLEKWYGITLCKLRRSVNSIDLDGVPDNTAKSKGGNNLQGILPDLQLPYLVRLYLGSNNLTGTLPNFTNLQKATVISLSSNNISGQIPDFSYLKNLQRFELDYNEVKSTIPTFSASQKLRFLYLPHNQLHGEIPDFELPKLEVLLLQNNRLSGTIPPLESSKKIKTLKLADNQLTGAVPDVNHLKNMTYFNVSNNKLEDLPKLEKLSKLEDFLVSNNQLGFDDLLPNKQYFTSFEDYKNQHPKQSDTLIFKELGMDYALKSQDKTTAGNSYFWYKNEDIVNDKNTDNRLELNSLDESDAGFYHYEITNDQLPGLEIESGLITLHVEEKNEFISDNVISEKSNLIFSGRITPNGDGRNDVFTVATNTGIVSLELSQLEIYNANGQLVYRAAPYQNNWRGTLMDSQNPLPPGAYFYRFALDKTKKFIESGTTLIIK